MSDTRERLTEIFLDVLDLDELDLKDDLTANDVEEWDSLSHVRLVVSIEREFGIKFSNAEIEGLANVGQMISLIETKKAA